jgi:hypothetical protein
MFALTLNGGIEQRIVNVTPGMSDYRRSGFRADFTFPVTAFTRSCDRSATKSEVSVSNHMV